MRGIRCRSWEFAGSGHIDAAMIAFVTLALWSKRRPGPDRAGRWPAGTLVKLYPAALLPALWRRWDWRMPALFGVAVVAAYLPFAGAGAHVFGFLPGYAAEEGFAGGTGFYWWNLATSFLPPGGVSTLPYIAAALCLLLALAVRHRVPAGAGAEYRYTRRGAARRHFYSAADAALSVVFLLARRLRLSGGVARAGMVDGGEFRALLAAGLAASGVEYAPAYRPSLPSMCRF